jgi:hypothetical protein
MIGSLISFCIAGILKVTTFRPMRLFSLFAATVTALGISATPALAQISLFIGGPQGEFLGRVAADGQNCSRYDSNCIWNPYSDHGSQYGTFSIFNNYGDYGSEYGAFSVCNMNISYEESPALYLTDGNK